jgi:effector-binding domain-containing protein
MVAEPRVAERSVQPYVAIQAFVTMQDLGAVLPALHPEVFGWLGARGIAPAGAPFWKYNVVDMERQLEVEVGVPVADPVPGDDRVRAGVLPAGRYATLRHTGHPDGLADATAALLEWAAAEGLTWDVTRTDQGDEWAARLEIYETDPAQEPDLNNWETQLAFRLSG